MKLTRITTSKKKDTLTVSDVVFGQPANAHLLSQAVRVYRSNQRQGTSKVKTRAEVDLTKKKMYKQKGTGNARHGAQSAPIFVGGGVAHGPKGNENWSLDLSKKMKKKSLCLALSAQASAITIVDGLAELTGVTKQAHILLQEVLAGVTPKHITVILGENQEQAYKALRNIASVRLVRWQDLNALDIVSSDVVLVTTETVKKIEERLTAK